MATDKSPQTLVCPHCGHTIEIAEALKHQIEETVLAAERQKYSEELVKAKEVIEKQVEKKFEENFNLSKRNLEEELKETKIRSKNLEEQLIVLTSEMRKLRQESESQRLDLAKKLASEEEKIRLTARRQVEEEQSLKIREKEKQLEDALKQNEILNQKLRQGSQQMQGEVLELEIEEILKKEFPQDEILPIGKGVRGADVIQKVMDKQGRHCGTILWESKNAKWSEGWITKLKEDQRIVKADLVVLASVNLPADVETFVYRNGVWVTSRKTLLGLASALRLSLYQVFVTKQSSIGKNEKMERLYTYLIGPEFKQRVEAIVEGFTRMQEELEREKNWFATKWSRQEKEIRKVLDHTLGLHGDLEGLVGNALPEIKTLVDAKQEELQLE